MITDPVLTNLRLLFKPTAETKLDSSAHLSSPSTQQASLLLYSHRFALFLDNMGRVELRYLQQITQQEDDNNNNNLDHDYVGTKITDDNFVSTTSSSSSEAHNKISKEVTRVIGSRDVEFGKWNELIITDSTSDDHKYDPSEPLNSNTILIVTPDKIQLDMNDVTHRQQPSSREGNHSELFLAGLPHRTDGFNTGRTSSTSRGNRWILDGGQLGVSGFTGCIKALQINERIYGLRSDLNGDALDGFDIGKLNR